jgi:hypothetical protein
MILMMLKLADGSYVNTAHVSRFFVTEDPTRSSTRYAIKVSMNGPQMPFTVSTFPSPQEAHAALDQMVYRIEQAAIEAGVIGLYSIA